MTCKRPDCPEPVADERGPYGGLCAEHKEEQRTLRQGEMTSQGVRVTQGPTTPFADRVKRLAKAAKAIDRAKAQATAAGKKLVEAKAEYKAALDALQVD